MADVSCHGCGAVIDEPSDLPPEEREPCPACGETKRDFSIQLQGFASANSFGSGTLTVAETFPRLPGLLLQAVLLTGDKTNDGRLVAAVAPVWFDIIKLLERDPDAAFQIPPRKWEEIIAGSYEHAGYDKVILTPRSRDGGRDVIAMKHGSHTVKVVDEVKAYRRGHLVTAEVVRALYGVAQLDKAAKGFVTTTSDFAPMITSDPLLGPVIPSQVELINGEKLLRRLVELASESS